jgi:signal transduction histidine kinase/ActR/RegA family two-component response regulator
VYNPAAQQMVGIAAFAGEPDKWSEHYGLFLPDMVSLYPSDRLPIARAIRGESVDGAEMFVRRAGAAKESWISVSARPVREDGGKIHGAVMVVRDVTASKVAAEALNVAKQEAERANQAKSEFLSRMSHELRTPLNSVLGFAQLLELDDLTPQQADNVQRILKGGKHLLGLINEVLDLARIESGRFSLSPEPVGMVEALRDALDLIQPLAVQRNVKIKSDVAIHCDLHVYADRQRLKQVLLNLLSNAIKFNHSGGSVALSCGERPNNRLRLEVADTGTGISTEEMQKIFRPFERLGADQNGIEGTGLGLALTKRLVEAMGGTIGVESVVGFGSRFFIELALADNPSRSVEKQLDTTLTPGYTPGSRGTVLYIEDNLSNLQLMEQILEHCPGVKLLSAMEGRLGIELAQLHMPDWILLDLHLPDLEGGQVLRLLRENPKTRLIPVTVVSADATPGQISRLLAAGANDYLTKPLDVRNLLRLLEQTIQYGNSDREDAPIYAERYLTE